MKILIGAFILLLLGFVPAKAEEPQRAFSLFAGHLTSNNWDELFSVNEVDWVDSYFLAAALSQRLGGYQDLLSYEVEGQLVRHFHLQNNWEFNALGVLRWEPFWWDDWLDTSLAYGLGFSYATEKPVVEREKAGKTTARFLVYWMLELAFVPYAKRPDIEWFFRIHHRSSGYGLLAEEGGSNALATGLRYSF